MTKGGPEEKHRAQYPSYPYSSSGGYPPQSHKAILNLYPLAHSTTISSEQLKKQLDSRPVKEEVLDKKPVYPSIPGHTANHHPGQGYHHKDIKREPHNSVIVKRDLKQEIKMEAPVAAHSHHLSSPSSSSPRPQHPRPAHTPEHRPDRPLSSSTSPASGIPAHLLHHSSSSPSGHPPPSHGPPPPSHGHPPSHAANFRAADAHQSRSQSPYRPSVSQPQQVMPMALDYHKSDPNKIKTESRPSVSPHHQSYPASGPTPPSGAPVSASSAAMAHSYSLIQQGLVPNPIYSQGGAPHSSEYNAPGQPRMPMPSGVPQRSAQVSPPGNKRKPAAGKDANIYNRKKMKAQEGVSGPVPAMAIPVTTPEILSNPSPYTTTSSSVFSRPGTSNSSTSVNSATPSASPSLTAANLPPSMHSGGFIDSFKSFVENTVHIAFLEDSKKAQQEKAERERSQSGQPLSMTPGSVAGGPKYESQNQLDRKTEGSVSGSQPSAVVCSQMAAGQQPATKSEVTPANSETVNSRIIETINRVANNVDTDSDTLSASSPPPQQSAVVKPPTDTSCSSPLNRSLNSSSGSSSHPKNFKKAWLQRHDEDKKSEAPAASVPPAAPAPAAPTKPEVRPAPNSQPPASQAAGRDSSRDSISCVENPAAAHGDRGQGQVTNSPANVVVTLPNGNLSDLNHRNDESTSSASEAEMQVSHLSTPPWFVFVCIESDKD